MPQKFSNKARSQLLAAITTTDTSFSVVLGEADLFPTANVGTGTLPYAPGNWFKAVLENGDDFEIVYVRSRAAGSNVFSNVLRGQEGTVAKNFPVDSVVSLRVTAQDAEVAANINLTITGNVIVNVGPVDGVAVIYSGISTEHVIVLKVEVDAGANDRYDIEIYDGAVSDGGTLVYRAQQVQGNYLDSFAFYHQCQNTDLHARVVNLRQDGASFNANVKIALMPG